MSLTRSETGQASIDLVAALPVLLLVGAICWQFALAGHSLWMGAQAARSGARAAVVGADVDDAARASLPAHLRAGAKVRESGSVVRVRVPVPMLVPAGRSPWSVGSEASLGGGS